MFSGIVEAIGEIEDAAPGPGGGRRLTVSAPFHDLERGESVCVSGACLTVTTMNAASFAADVSPETLRRTKLGTIGAGDRVNLERSLRIGDRLSGHLVFGHVDAVGRLSSVSPEGGGSALYRFEVPAAVSRYLVEKGSVAVDGVSLTVFEVTDSGFTVAVIPHTAEVTTLGSLAPGDPVNLEADMLAKYVEKLVSPRLPPR